MYSQPVSCPKAPQVRNVGLVSTPPHHRELAGLPDASNKVSRVVAELLETELAYVNSLVDIKEGYYEPLSGQNRFEVQTLDTIFSNIVQIHAFHQSFLAELSRHCSANPLGLADAFLNHAADFEELYVEFCTEHSISIQTLERECQQHSDLWTAVLACQEKLGHVLPLASYLLKPVQRVLKYQLILQELIKGCTSLDAPTEHLQIALERMIQVASHINEAKRRQELIDQLRTSGLDVDQWGDLLLKDVFRLPAKKHACRMALLFERAILLAKKFSYRWDTGNNSSPNLLDLQKPSLEAMRSVLEIREIISCDNLMLIECIDKNPLAFHILPFDNPKAQKTLQAASVVVKQLWCREIKRVILENFDAAIPEKAKHLVLHMEDILPKLHVPSTTEEYSVPRRKSTSVLTGMFKRRNWGSGPPTKSAFNPPPPLPPPPASPPAALPTTRRRESSSNGDTSEEWRRTSPLGETDHVAVVQDAWNRLMAKHSTAGLLTTTTDAVSSREEPPTPSERSSQAGVEEDLDFRCIAVEINEERFAVDLPPHQKPQTLKPTSPPRCHQEGPIGTPQGGMSIYIDCQEASQYDTVTFGRAYEQYIAKTRSRATLSPGDLDEILRPLLSLNDDLILSTNGNAALTPPDNKRPGDTPVRVVRSAASSDESSESSSPCHLISRIAIDTSRLTPALQTVPQKNFAPQPRPRETVATLKRATAPRVTSPVSRPRVTAPRRNPAPPPGKRPPLSNGVDGGVAKPPRVVPSIGPVSRPSNRGTTGSSHARRSQIINAPTVERDSEVAAAVCRGRVRAAVDHLRSGDREPHHLTLSSKPLKPPRTHSTSMGPGGRIATLNGAPANSPLTLPPVVRPAQAGGGGGGGGGGGHVKGLIDKFQCTDSITN